MMDLITFWLTVALGCGLGMLRWRERLWPRGYHWAWDLFVGWSIAGVFVDGVVGAPAIAKVLGSDVGRSLSGAALPALDGIEGLQAAMENLSAALTAVELIIGAFGIWLIVRKSSQPFDEPWLEEIRRKLSASG